MTRRTSVERELRTRVSPELFASGLVIMVAVLFAGLLSLAQPLEPEPGAGNSTAGPTSTPTASATPVATATLDTKSLQAILALNKRIAEIATEAKTVGAAEPFDASDAAATLRRLNAAVTSARGLSSALEREPRTAIVGSGLQTFYLGLKALADEALRSSLTNADAYKSALAEIPTRMSRLTALDEELNALLH